MERHTRAAEGVRAAPGITSHMTTGAEVTGHVTARLSKLLRPKKRATAGKSGAKRSTCHRAKAR